MTWVSPAERRALRAVCVFSLKKIPHNGDRLDTKALHRLAVRGWVKACGEHHWRATAKGLFMRGALREASERPQKQTFEERMAQIILAAAAQHR